MHLPLLYRPLSKLPPKGSCTVWCIKHWRFYCRFNSVLVWEIKEAIEKIRKPVARDYVYRFCYDYNSVSGYFQSRIGFHLQHSDCNILLKPFAESIKVILFWRESQIEGMLKLNLISWTLYSTALSDKSLLHFCYEWMSLLLTFKFVKIKRTKKK